MSNVKRRMFAVEGVGGNRSFAVESPLARAEAAKDVKLVNDPKVWSSVQLNPLILQNQPGPEIVLPNNPTTPEKEIERFQDYLKRLYPKNEDTVGDLSVVKAQRSSPEQVRQRLRAIRDGLSVGDLSAATDAKERDAGKGLDQLFIGKPVETNPLTESQRLAADMIRKHNEAAELRFRLKNPSVQDRE